MMLPLAFFDFLSPPTIILVAIIAVLLYGERLPEVARSFGKQFIEFKKSLQGIRNEFEAAARDVTGSVDHVVTSVTREDPADREQATAPKFEPPPSEPVAPAERDAGREQPTAPKFEPPAAPIETH